MMHWYGLRDFKLKVGYDDDPERVAAVIRVLGRSLGSKATLRLDANGGWKVEDAIARLNALPLGKIACVEQPLDRNHDPYLVELKAMVQVQIMPDESLVTMDDARRLVAMGVADRFNIRISKNGGLLPAIRLAHFARQRGLGYQLGCMVGETSILSAAGRRFLENVPHVCFAEGSYGRFLLLGDVIDRPLQFGCRGRVKALGGYGWGIEVRPDRLRQYAQSATIEVRL
jgi:muconate cycloisomerase